MVLALGSAKIRLIRQTWGKTVTEAWHARMVNSIIRSEASCILLELSLTRTLRNRLALTILSKIGKENRSCTLFTMEHGDLGEDGSRSRHDPILASHGQTTLTETNAAGTLESRTIYPVVATGLLPSVLMRSTQIVKAKRWQASPTL